MGVWSRRGFYGLAAYVTGSVFFERVGSVAACDGRSMEPAIQDGNWVAVHRFVQSIERNDVVLLRSPQDPHEFLVKRVVKLEGENIHRNFVSGKSWVPRGHVWLEGDNKEMSLDSRDYGPIPKGLITGKVFLTFWPLSQAGFISKPPPTLIETLKAESDFDPWADEDDNYDDDADDTDDDDNNFDHANDLRDPNGTMNYSANHSVNDESVIVSRIDA